MVGGRERGWDEDRKRRLREKGLLTKYRAQLVEMFMASTSRIPFQIHTALSL